MRVKLTTIISALIFLTFLGFAGLENYLILTACVIILFVGISKRDLNRPVISLFLILLIHVIIYFYNYSRFSIDWIAKNFLNPVLLCFIGYWLTTRSQSDKMPTKLLIYGFFLHGALNVLLYVMNPSSMTERSFVNIWGGQLTATLQNLLFIPTISLLFYGLYVIKSKRRKIAIIAACVIAVYGTIISASRTLLYLVAICFLINMIFNAQKNHNKSIKVLVSVLILLTVSITFYEFDLMGIRSWVESSSLGERLAAGVGSNDSLIENVRWTMSLKILTALPSHPFGNITAVHYAHNLFLDIAKYTGIIPALGVFLWSVVALVKYFFHIRSDFSDEWDTALFSMAIGLMIVFFLEPVLEGLPIIFSAFCYLCGVMKGRRDRVMQNGV